MGAGCPVTTEATTINKVCASGLKSVTLAAASLMIGSRKLMVIDICVMSFALGCWRYGKHVKCAILFSAKCCFWPSTGKRCDYQGWTYRWLFLSNPRKDAYDKIHMGVCAEETAVEHSISREVQDEHCRQSYTRAANAWEKGIFATEIAPVVIKSRKGETVVDKDEEFKNIDFSKLSKLKGAFVKDGTGTTIA